MSIIVHVRRLDQERALLYAYPSDPEPDGWAEASAEWPEDIQAHVSSIHHGGARYEVPPDAGGEDADPVLSYAPKDMERLPAFFSGTIVSEVPLGDLADEWAADIESLKTQPQLTRVREIAHAWFLTDFSPAEGDAPVGPNEQTLQHAIERWFQQTTGKQSTPLPDEAEVAHAEILSVLASGLVTECTFVDGGLAAVATLDFVKVSEPVGEPKELELAVEQNDVGFDIAVTHLDADTGMGPVEGGMVRCHCYVSGHALPRMDTPIVDGIPRLQHEVGPFEHLDEVFRWEVELVDQLGQVHHRGLVEQVRERCFLPAAPGALRVVQHAGGKTTLSFDPPANNPHDEPSNLRLEIWCRDLPLAPSGFYGDDDDALVLEGLRALDLLVEHDSQSGGRPQGGSADGGHVSDEALAALVVQTDAERAAIARILSRDVPTYDSLLDDCSRLYSGSISKSAVDLPLAMKPLRSYECFFRTRRLTGSAAEKWSASSLQRCRHFVQRVGEQATEVSYLEPIPDSRPERSFARTVSGDVTATLPLEGTESSPEPGSTVHLAWLHAAPYRRDGAQVPPGGYRIWSRDIIGDDDPEPFRLMQNVKVLHPRVFALYRPTLSATSSGWTEHPLDGVDGVSRSGDARARLMKIVETFGHEGAPFRVVDLRAHDPEGLRRLADEGEMPADAPLRNLHALHASGFGCWLAPKANALDRFLDGDRDTLARELRSLEALDQHVLLATFEGSQGAFAPILLVAPPTLTPRNDAYDTATDRLRQEHRFTRQSSPEESRPLGRPSPHAGVTQWSAGSWVNWRYRALEEDPWAHRVEFLVEPLDRYSLFYDTFEEPAKPPSIEPLVQPCRVHVPRRKKPAQPVVIAEVTPNESAVRFRITEPDELRAASSSALRRVRLANPTLEFQPTAVHYAMDPRLPEYITKLSIDAERGANGRWWTVRPNDTDGPLVEPLGTRRQDVHRPFWFTVEMRARVTTDDVAGPPWMPMEGSDGEAASAVANRVPHGLGIPELPRAAIENGQLVVRIRPSRLRDHLDPERVSGLGPVLGERLSSHANVDALPNGLRESAIADLPDFALEYELLLATNRRPNPHLKSVARITSPRVGESGGEPFFRVTGPSGDALTATLVDRRTLKVILPDSSQAGPRLFLRLKRDGKSTPPIALEVVSHD